MQTYEVFCIDETGEAHLVGIIPERRKQTERVTKESVLQRLGMLFGETITLNPFLVTQVYMDDQPEQG